MYNNTDNGIDADGVQDSVFRNNLMYGNGRNALRVFQIDAAAGPKNLKVINNTLIVPSGGGWALKFTEDLGGHTFFNNILLSDNSSTGSIPMANTNFVSNNNALVGRLSYNGESTTVGLAAWQAAAMTPIHSRPPRQACSSIPARPTTSSRRAHRRSTLAQRY